MSDFLGNLATKSLGLAPMVQPRPLSPFEALPAEGAFAGRLAAEAPAEPVEFETESAAWHRLTARKPVQPAAFTPPAQIERRAPVQPLVVSLPQVALQAEAPGPALQRTPAPQPPAELASAPLGRPQPPAKPAPELLERSPWPSPRPTPALQLVESPSASARPVAAVASESQAAPPARRIVLTPVIEEIKPSPPAAPAESRAQLAERGEPVPTISVTIGRVEVHAALSPAASAQRAAAGAKPAAGLSLNDYLRLRSGGKP